jgi:ATP-dependent RNA helicase RhlE
MFQKSRRPGGNSAGSSRPSGGAPRRPGATGSSRPTGRPSSSRPTSGGRPGARTGGRPGDGRFGGSSGSSKPRSSAPRRSFGEKKPFERKSFGEREERDEPTTYRQADKFGPKPARKKFDKMGPARPRTQRRPDDKPRFEQPRESLDDLRRRSIAVKSPNRPQVKNAKPANQKQKLMEVDYNLMVKTATPQAIADYTAKKTFAEHGLNTRIVTSLEKKGYTQPTAIQDQAIPHIMESKDIIGIANTGTGKTAAFLLPLIHQTYNDLKKRVLILAPTRELVTQIAKELTTFTKGSSISSTIIVGGLDIGKQIIALRKNVNFIISTTGRGLDLINRGELKIAEIDTIVLDEMDQMLDMGFIKDIREILKLAVSRQHLLFFSATITKDIQKIALEILNNPVTVSVVQGQTTDNVNQDVIEYTAEENKFDLLCDLLSKPEVEKAIVFENTKHGAAKIEKELTKRGFKALAIHGNKNQNQRTRALDSFKKNEIQILIATNVAARGLDIPLVSHVINYTLPQSREDYIHRIGRTGRAGEVGHAYTFVAVKRKGGREE